MTRIDIIRRDYVRPALAKRERLSAVTAYTPDSGEIG